MVDESQLVNELEYKVILLGKSGVGKTSVFKRLKGEDFCQEELSTLGIDTLRYNSNYNEGKKVKLVIWDTAGQERFKALSKSFYKNTEGFLVIYDITDEESFEQLGMWIKSIYDNCSSFVEKPQGSEKAIIYILGNKCDLEGMRKVSKKQGEDFAKQYDFYFRETSALTKVNIDETIDKLGKEMHQYKYISPEQNVTLGHKALNMNKKKKECCGKL